MSELFSNENIFINVSVASQNDAIEKAGQALVDSGAVTENYIQAMNHLLYQQNKLSLFGKPFGFIYTRFLELSTS